MDPQLKTCFTERWERHFPGAELPLAFAYVEDPGDAEPSPVSDGFRCLVGALNPVRAGHSRCFDLDRVACPGGRRYTGFSQELMPGIEHFLSCGIPGRLKGERYKKSPELALEFLKVGPTLQAPSRWLVFKRWDRLGERDEPAAVLFFAPPDVLAGLFTLANYDEPGLDAVRAPFCAGCGSLVLYPWLENLSENPRCILGMFDPSARPCMPAGVLSFAAPWRKFVRMVGNMDESFLVTPTWEVIRKRVRKEGKAALPESGGAR